MILAETSEPRLVQMRQKLMMEGVFNRESYILNMAIKVASIIEDFKTDLELAAEYYKRSYHLFDSDDLEQMIEASDGKIEGRVLVELGERLEGSALLAKDVIEEMGATIKEFA